MILMMPDHDERLNQIESYDEKHGCSSPRHANKTVGSREIHRILLIVDEVCAYSLMTRKSRKKRKPKSWKKRKPERASRSAVSLVIWEEKTLYPHPMIFDLP